MKPTIHTQKVLSLEAAKLLGTAFTWGNCVEAFRYVPSNNGLVLQSCTLDEYTPETKWHQYQAGETADSVFTESLVHPVTFSEDD